MRSGNSARAALTREVNARFTRLTLVLGPRFKGTNVMDILFSTSHCRAYTTV